MPTWCTGRAEGEDVAGLRLRRGSRPGGRPRPAGRRPGAGRSRGRCRPAAPGRSSRGPWPGRCRPTRRGRRGTSGRSSTTASPWVLPPAAVVDARGGRVVQRAGEGGGALPWRAVLGAGRSRASWAWISLIRLVTSATLMAHLRATATSVRRRHSSLGDLVELAVLAAAGARRARRRPGARRATRRRRAGCGRRPSGRAPAAVDVAGGLEGGAGVGQRVADQARSCAGGPGRRRGRRSPASAGRRAAAARSATLAAASRSSVRAVARPIRLSRSRTLRSRTSPRRFPCWRAHVVTSSCRAAQVSAAGVTSSMSWRRNASIARHQGEGERRRRGRCRRRRRRSRRAP